MNAIAPDLAHRWPQERGPILGQAWNDLLVWAHRREMSDLHIQTNRRVKIVVHGRFHDATRRAITHEEATSLCVLLYGATALAHLKDARDFDLAHVVETRTGERYSIGGGTGRVDGSAPGGDAGHTRERHRFRINGTPIVTNGVDGVQITVRRIENEPPTLASLGLEEPILRALRPRNGFVGVCGAVGTGKTRLLAGVTRDLIEDPHSHRKVVELAAPLEYEFDRIDGRGLYSPSEIPRSLKTPLAGLVGSLRRAGQVLIAPECRDRETMEVAMTAAQTGAAVYGTLHTNSLVETVQRILGMFPESERADRATSLAQMLRLLVNCLLVPSTDGRRTQLREYLAFGPQEREVLLDAPVNDWPRLTRRLLREKGQSFAQAAEKARHDGLISAETAQDVMEAF